MKLLSFFLGYTHAQLLTDSRQASGPIFFRGMLLIDNTGQVGLDEALTLSINTR